jgi:2-(1,2-epoxy-1,2-dihydrophenyl)acetyl-CoA isomerase
MSKFNTVKYEQDEAVAIITIDRPDAMNSFDGELRRELLGAFERAAGDKSVRAVVLTGEGRSFSAGADLKAGLGKDKTIQEVLQEEYRPVLECIATMPQPVIAAVNGSAAGIGMSYALGCDLMIMADNAFLLSPFTTISLVPDGGLNWLLVHQLGYRRAFQLSIESQRITAALCVELGLANKAVPADKLVGEAVAWAKALSERAPLSIATTKQAMRHAASADWASTFDLEASNQDRLASSADSAEGIAAFFEKRKANFTGQ